MSESESKSIGFKKILKIAFIVIVAVVVINIIVFLINLLKSGENFVKDVIKTVLGPFIGLADQTGKACNKQKDCNGDQNYSKTKKLCEDEATCFWDENTNACQNATKRKEGTTDTAKCAGFIILDIITGLGLLGLMGFVYKTLARVRDVDPALKDLARKNDGIDIYKFKKSLSDEMEADLEKDLEEFNEEQKKDKKPEITSESGKRLYGELKLRKRLTDACYEITSKSGNLTPEQQANFHTEFYNSHVKAYDIIKEQQKEKAEKGEITKEEREAIDEIELERELKPEPFRARI